MGNREKSPLEEDLQRGVGKALPKHQLIFDYLHSRILNNSFKPGDRLPSEAELGKTFNASRITVAKAVLELQRMNLVTRRPGAGTHVTRKPQAAGYTLGLLIPELGRTEIFDPICHGMMRSPFARPDSLLWPSISRAGGISSAAAPTDKEAIEQAEHIAQHFISQQVAGVFFAPLELVAGMDAANRRIMRMLERSRMPVVLLDRCYLPYPERSENDLVGIDNRRTGFQITQRLIRGGVKRLLFFAEPYSAPTVDARISGFLEASRQVPDAVTEVRTAHALDRAAVQKVLEQVNPDGIVCANDVTAARLMQTVLTLGRRIPEEIQMVGIDDVRYASLLPVPLTTMHQDCNAIGVIAMATMLERLEHPDLPMREILLSTRLVERNSCRPLIPREAALAGGMLNIERME